ncbi:hypothetical protein ABBQ38_005704 [Trebouxia sp. C0009 RCD-2024]
MTANLQSPSCIKTLAASPATSSQSASPSSNSLSENPFTAARVTAADRSLLVRVLNRNLIQQREDANLQSLGSDPLLTSLPAGSPLSYPNTATARNVADQLWSPIESHLTGIDSPDDRSPVTPAAALLSDCNSPTSVLLHSTGRLRADATAPPPPTPASCSEPCTPSSSIHHIHKSSSTSNLAQLHEPSAAVLQQHVVAVAFKAHQDMWRYGDHDAS